MNFLEKRLLKVKNRFKKQFAFEIKHFKPYIRSIIFDFIVTIIFVSIAFYYAGQMHMCQDMGGYIPYDNNSGIFLKITCEPKPNETIYTNEEFNFSNYYIGNNSINERNYLKDFQLDNSTEVV